MLTYKSIYEGHCCINESYNLNFFCPKEPAKVSHKAHKEEGTLYFQLSAQNPIPIRYTIGTVATLQLSTSHFPLSTINFPLSTHLNP
jgi:hypothetical protein